MKAMTLATCSSSGRPSSAAPRRRSSRDTARANALSFIRFRTEAGFEVEHAPRWAHQRGGGDESGHFVAGVQRLLEQAFPGDAAVVGVRQDRAHDPLGISAALQLLAPAKRVIGGRRVALVVEVVQQRDRSPRLFVFTELPRVAPDGGFHGQRVLPQALARTSTR